MEFVSKLFDIIYETVGSATPEFSELSKSKQSITSEIGNDMEETDILTPL
jgi:hypothetical protein